MATMLLVSDAITKAYKEKIGYDADFYVVEIGDGPTII